MSSHATQETLTSLDRAEFLSASTRTHMPLVTPKLTAVYGTPSTSDGETPRAIDFDHVQESNAQLLDDTVQDVREKANTYRVEKMTLSQLRKRRKDQGDLLGQHQREMTKSIVGAYGPEALALFGLDVEPARAYTAVREQTLDISERMRRPDLLARLGQPRPGHSGIDFEKLAEILEGAVKVFEQLTIDITRQVKVKDEALIAKNEALGTQRRVLANVARVQEGYYRLAGLDDLADRIRVTIPKRTARKDGSGPQEPSDDGKPKEKPSGDPPPATPPRDPAP